MTKFTQTDAAQLMILVRRAPLKNMDEAAFVHDLLDRFTEFFEDNIEGGVMPTGDKDAV